MKTLLLTVLATILINGCASTIPVVVELPLPPELSLPAIDAQALSCLSDEAYTNLVQRDRLQAERRATLRSIIETTHDAE